MNNPPKKPVFSVIDRGINLVILPAVAIPPIVLFGCAIFSGSETFGIHPAIISASWLLLALSLAGIWYRTAYSIWRYWAFKNVDDVVVLKDRIKGQWLEWPENKYLAWLRPRSRKQMEFELRMEKESKARIREVSSGPPQIPERLIPIPSHLRKIIEPTAICDETCLDGKLRCICGCNQFKLHVPDNIVSSNNIKRPLPADAEKGFFFAIEAECLNCHTPHLLFDAALHGYNALICNGDGAVILSPRPFVDWVCSACSGEGHEIIVTTRSRNRHEAKLEYGDFPKYQGKNWADPFDSFSMTITCSQCGTVSDDWVDYETA